MAAIAIEPPTVLGRATENFTKPIVVSTRKRARSTASRMGMASMKRSSKSAGESLACRSRAAAGVSPLLAAASSKPLPSPKINRLSASYSPSHRMPKSCSPCTWVGAGESDPSKRPARRVAAQPHSGPDLASVSCGLLFGQKGAKQVRDLRERVAFRIERPVPPRLFLSLEAAAQVLEKRIDRLVSDSARAGHHHPDREALPQIHDFVGMPVDHAARERASTVSRHDHPVVDLDGDENGHVKDRYGFSLNNFSHRGLSVRCKW